MKRLKYTVCATITPMNDDGSVDLSSAARLISFLLEKGMTCFYPNGTNGESLSLTETEREKIAHAVVEAASPGGTVFIQCGAGSAAQTRENIRRAHRVGADGIGVMSPVFFACDETALEAALSEELKEAGDLPCYLYNIPSRTGTDISPAVFGRLMEAFPSLIGIKYSAPDLLRVQDYLRAAPRACDVLIGCDRLALAHMAVGGAGWVSGPAAAFPELFSALNCAVEASDGARAMALIRHVESLSVAMSQIPEIPAIKYLLMRRGAIACDRCRRPLRPLTAQEKATLDAVLASYTVMLHAIL